MEEKDKISVEIMPEADGEERNSVSETPKTDVKGTVKDSVFRDLFGNRKYALQLYQALHPEDTDVTEVISIMMALFDQKRAVEQYGYDKKKEGETIGEARGEMKKARETAWTVNIIIRILLYLAHIWNEYIETTSQNRYGSKKLELPRPELYMIYTGKRKTRSEWLNLSDEFFEGNRDFLEAKVRVLYGEGKR